MPTSNPSEFHSSEEISQLIRAGLERLRKKLLDLGKGNRLLNFRHGKKSSLRVVDELPDELFKRLKERGGLKFRPVPEPEPEIEKIIELLSGPPALFHEKNSSSKEEYAAPPNRKISAKEYAEKIGINTSYELPEPELITPPEHLDEFIQTLHYPDDLDAILLRIASSARTAIEETGTNMLYLNFGFLEWYESPVSDQTLLAPLVALPVEIKKANFNPRGTGGKFEYVVENTGEDILTNLSLGERLKRDFSLIIPMLEEDDTPEIYFKKFSEILSIQPRWRIRRQITLTLLQFGKLLMFLDLDPSRNSSLLNHPRIKEILGGTTEGGGTPYGDVYELDTPDIAQQLPPLFFDADSSQHSALLDVSQGNNLVIEGPPGTGKSQTISNLIALALFKGKTVLFVSEKLAALEVVRRRLDQAGLGDFCLELHSHKTKRDRVLQDINQRLQNQSSYASVNGFKDQIDIFTRQKDELVKYAQLINQPFGLFHQTIFDIIWAREALVTKCPFLSGLDAQFRIINADSLTVALRHDQQTNVELFAEQLRILLTKFSGVSAHPWRGIRKSNVQEDQILKILTELKQYLSELLQEAEAFFQKTANRLNTSFCGLKSLSQTVLPQPSGGELWEKFSTLKVPEARLEVSKYIEDLNVWNATKEFLGSKIKNLSALEASHSSNCLSEIISQLQSENFGHLKLEEISVQEKIINGEKKLLNKALAIINLVTQEIIETIPINLHSLNSLFIFLQNLAKADFEQFYLRNPIIWETQFNETRKRAAEEAQKICDLRNSLEQRFFLGHLPPSEVLWHYAQIVFSSSILERWFSSKYKMARNCYRSLSKKGVSERPAIMGADFKNLAEYQNDLLKFQDNLECSEVFDSLFKFLDTPFSEIADLQKWFQNFKNDLNPYLPEAQLYVLAMEHLPVETLRLVKSKAFEDQSFIEGLDLAFVRLTKVFHPINIPGDMDVSEAIGFLGTISDLLHNANETLKTFEFQNQIKVDDLPSLISLSKDFFLDKEKLDSNNRLSVLLGSHYKGSLSDLGALQATLKLHENILNLNIPVDLQEWLLTSECPERLTFLDKFLRTLPQQLSQYLDLWSDFEKLTDVEVGHWYGQQSESWEHLALQELIDRFDEALDGSVAFSGWTEYLCSRQPLVDAQVLFLVDHAEKGILKPTQLETAYEFALYNGLTTLIFEHFPQLLDFYGVRHEKIREQFQELDKEIIQLTRKQAACKISQRRVPPGNKMGRIRDYTDLALIRHEISKRRGHIAIRKLIDRSHNALLGLKPCFMMGPMSVAQYLGPGKFHFDLVVMDEASQLKAEEAIGAIARGSQVVIVGDPKQLPPTSFFDMMMGSLEEEEEIDDTLAIEESESILETAIEVYRPVRQLRWHYRSRHESLIAFSNHRFYDQNLILFPSIEKESPYLGIKYHFDSTGIYDARANKPEAKRVVEAVLEHMKNNFNESLGVATFNSPQRDLIEDLLDEHSKNDPISQAYITHWEEKGEPFFIKNLETVQGDERDCIFISFTYGKDSNGNMYQRFGPINGSNGHRRLNVIFTRAKNRTELFTSMEWDNINVGPNSSQGVEVMQAYLKYAKTGKLEIPTVRSGPEPNDFEIAVGNALRECGLKIVSQVGVAGYFIDLAVCHPEKQGRYLLGIECDGATYHSAKSARDRDRLRQLNLVNLGWRIHRIWSTDWFKNKKAEITKIVMLYNQLVSQTNSNSVGTPEVFPADSHSIEEKNVEIIKQIIEKLTAPFSPGQRAVEMIVPKEIVHEVLKCLQERNIEPKTRKTSDSEIVVRVEASQK